MNLYVKWLKSLAEVGGAETNKFEFALVCNETINQSYVGILQISNIL